MPTRLIGLNEGGFFVDTPGIRQFQLWDVIPEEVYGYFQDIRPYINRCRFPDCSHTHEDGCGGRTASQTIKPTCVGMSYMHLRNGDCLDCVRIVIFGLWQGSLATKVAPPVKYLRLFQASMIASNFGDNRKTISHVVHDILLFVLVPIAELTLLLMIAEATHWWLSLLIVIATGLLGRA